MRQGVVSRRNAGPCFPVVQFVADVELWFARDGRVSIRDQLATQLMLAIASGDLPCGKRLPSTRALAKRFQLNVNTVSAAYQQLENLGWVKSIRGSGVYVRTEQTQLTDARLQVLDRVVLALLRTARSAGVSANALRERIDHWLGMRPNRFVFIHPDQGLRAIICHELRQTMTWKVQDSEPKADEIAPYVHDSIFLTVPSKHADVCSLVPPWSEVVALQVRPVDRALSHYLPIRPELLIVVVSGWSGFLEIARAVLAAAGCDPEIVVFRDAERGLWERSLPTGSVVICDMLTSAGVPRTVQKIVFTLVSDASIAMLRTYQEFFCE
jgi:GntR family transcriptional regulator